ncbi:MAG TPA: VIT1/CCC1 transporter family protein [Thermoplasmata archaeon]|nr:VIT1/CCC1 transporter family protein [Thermoplasmata archaeon]
MARTGSIRSRIKMAVEMHDLLPIARRYFVIGAFDGALTIMGVILGAYAAGALTKNLVLVAGSATGIALAVSSAVGAYEAERIEFAIHHKEIERAMLSTVEGTRKESAKIGNLASAFVHGIAPLIAALIPLIPFFFMSEYDAMVAAIVITICFLFVMGAYLGSLMKEMIFYTGLRFVAAGLITAIIVFLLHGE